MNIHVAPNVIHTLKIVNDSNVPNAVIIMSSKHLTCQQHYYYLSHILDAI